MTWIYKGKPFVEQPSEDIIGMVYLITELDTGKVYVGIKKFWKIIKYKPLKGRKNKRHKKRESDWREYISSSDYLKREIPLNPTNYKREVLILCNNITEMKLYEAHIQISMWVNGNWDKMINQFIGLKLYVK